MIIEFENKSKEEKEDKITGKYLTLEQYDCMRKKK
jgi:hypothetical protein